MLLDLFSLLSFLLLLASSAWLSRLLSRRCPSSLRIRRLLIAVRLNSVRHVLLWHVWHSRHAAAQLPERGVNQSGNLCRLGCPIFQCDAAYWVVCLDHETTARGLLCCCTFAIATCVLFPSRRGFDGVLCRYARLVEQTRRRGSAGCSPQYTKQG